MEEKIKIELKHKGDYSFKIGESAVKIKPWLESKYVAFVVEKVLDVFHNAINEKVGDVTAVVTAFSVMDMYLVALSTNLDISDLTIDDIGPTGLVAVIHEKLGNYEEIKTAIQTGMTALSNNYILNEQSPEKSVDELKELLESEESSEKVKNLVEVMLANNPTLAKELEKTLGSDDNGNKE